MSQVDWDKKYFRFMNTRVFICVLYTYALNKSEGDFIGLECLYLDCGQTVKSRCITFYLKHHLSTENILDLETLQILDFHIRNAQPAFKTHNTDFDKLEGNLLQQHEYLFFKLVKITLLFVS